MKVAITGHTSGLGLAIYDHMQALGHVVTGFSRSNGYKIPESIDTIVESITDYDLFFNNAHVGTTQVTFIEKLYNKISIVTSGSMAAEIKSRFNDPYFYNKHLIQVAHQKFKRLTTNPILLLRMGYLENFNKPGAISFNEILTAIDYWLEHPRISLIEFENCPEIYK